MSELKRYEAVNPYEQPSESEHGKYYLADDVDKHIEELKQSIKELADNLEEASLCLLLIQQKNERLRLLLWQCKKWHIEPRLEALKEIATEEQQGLINIFNGHLQQAEQLLKGGE